MFPIRRNHPVRGESSKLGCGNLPLKLCCLAISLFLVMAIVPRANAQQVFPAENSPSVKQPQEDVRAARTRAFLGLSSAPDAKAAAEGEKLYGPTCGFCHGAKARGGEGPDLLRSSVVLDDDKGELIGTVVRNGRTGKGMPAFSSFTDPQIYDLAEFLHLQVDLAANRGTYKALNVVTGNAKAGEAYFKGAGKCNTCHSPRGDLAHIGSKLQPADLQQTFLYPAPRQAGPPVSKVKVTLRDGETISGTLKHLDDFHVSLSDAAGNYHSIALEPGINVQVEDKLLAHRQMLDKYTDTQMHDLTAYLVTLK